MAAGLGSRYGGLKQIAPVGPSGEIMMEYAIYDALKAGFGQVVFIIKEELLAVFKECIGNTIEKVADVSYAFQRLDMLPPGVSLPAGREKPWGTAHAVLCAEDVVHTPFAVINADDFYGADTFALLAQYLQNPPPPDSAIHAAMVGFLLANTLTEHGHVARGVCTVSPSGHLMDVVERTRIEKRGDGAVYTEDGVNYTPLPTDTVVSMNTWGFFPDIFPAMHKGFATFFDAQAHKLQSAEYFLPGLVGDLIQAGKAQVDVLQGQGRWLGVTYPQDRQAVVQAIEELVRFGLYPTKLW